ncbi:MAG TPA: FGGY-family carbohydrate kinase [Acidisarcina sp.]
MNDDAAPPDQSAEQPSDLRALVAIDLGAESCRVSMLRWINGHPHIEVVHRFSNAPIVIAGSFHWDIEGIESGVIEGLKNCAQLAPEGIRSIDVDGWAVDYVRLDASGAAIGPPFCYRDERTIAAESKAHRFFSAGAMRRITGVQIMRINTVYQLFADEPHVRRHRWLNLPEYILHRLGGRPVSEFTNATHTQLIDLATRAWSQEIASALDLDLATFPELVQPGSDLGQLGGPLATFAAFRQTRLIAPACHDTASAITGISDRGDNWAYISSGTWSLVGTLLDASINNELARAENFTNLGAAGDRICIHKNVNGMWLIKQCIVTWAAVGLFTMQELIAEAECLPAPTFLLEVDEPDLLLPGDMPSRINAQLICRNLKPFSSGLKDAPAIASLIFHSLAARYAEVLEKIATITGKRLERIHIVGGASKNTFLNRLTAQRTGLEVIAGSPESATLGNFAVQLATLEQAKPATEGPTRLGAGRHQVSNWASALALTSSHISSAVTKSKQR